MNCSCDRRMFLGGDQVCFGGDLSADIDDLERFLFGFGPPEESPGRSGALSLAELYRGRAGYFTHADRTAPKD